MTSSKKLNLNLFKQGILLLLLLCIIDSAIILSLSFPIDYKEDAIAENIQVLLLILGFVFYTTQWFNLKRFKGVIAISLVICFGFILREVDLENHVSEWAHTLVTGWGRKILLTIFGLTALALLFNDLIKNRLLHCWLSSFSVCIFLCAIFLVLSWIFDKSVFKLSHNLMYEEISEINAYALIAIAAFYVPKKLTN